VKDLYDKNFTSLKEKIEKHLRKWRELTCLWNGMSHIVKVAILPNANYKFNPIPFKIPIQFFRDMERRILNFIWKKNRIVKSFLNNKRTSREITILDHKQYYRAVVIKTVWY